MSVSPGIRKNSRSRPSPSAASVGSSIVRSFRFAIAVLVSVSCGTHSPSAVCPSLSTCCEPSGVRRGQTRRAPVGLRRDGRLGTFCNSRRDRHRRPDSQGPRPGSRCLRYRIRINASWQATSTCSRPSMPHAATGQPGSAWVSGTPSDAHRDQSLLLAAVCQQCQISAPEAMNSSRRPSLFRATMGAWVEPLGLRVAE